MAVYAVQADLQRFALPASVVASCLAIDANSVTAALQGASDTADGYMRGQFVLPLVAPYPADLVRAVCKLAAYDLVSGTIGYNPEGDPSILKGWEQAMAWFKDVARGVSIPSITDSTPGGTRGPVPFVSSRRRRGW
jgi:phage gp36-like protein